ncbi:hypothetical protein [Methylobacterium nigriterrae]|uniref:hypothetical protein n=1 Tax=Methylobacterium nigriterrae TaxID=3127512 RepID=UPI0030132472
MRILLVTVLTLSTLSPAGAAERPAAHMAAPSTSPAPMAAPSNPVSREIESRADRARISDDAFERRIQASEERAARSICEGCTGRSRRSAAVADPGDTAPPYLDDPAQAPIADQ